MEYFNIIVGFIVPLLVIAGIILVGIGFVQNKKKFLWAGVECLGGAIILGLLQWVFVKLQDMVLPKGATIVVLVFLLIITFNVGRTSKES